MLTVRAVYMCGCGWWMDHHAHLTYVPDDSISGRNPSARIFSGLHAIKSCASIVYMCIVCVLRRTCGYVREHLYIPRAHQCTHTLELAYGKEENCRENARAVMLLLLCCSLDATRTPSPTLRPLCAHLAPLPSLIAHVPDNHQQAHWVRHPTQ